EPPAAKKTPVVAEPPAAKKTPVVVESPAAKKTPVVVEPPPKQKAKQGKVEPKIEKIHHLRIKKEVKVVEEIAITENVVRVDDASSNETYNRIHGTADLILAQVIESGKPIFEIPSRSSTNIKWDEGRDLLLLGDKVSKRPFHSLSSVSDSTRLMRIIEKVNEILGKNIHATKREIYYTDVDLFEDQKNSDKSIEDLSAMLKVIRNSTHIIASAKGSCIGRLKIRDTITGDRIDLERLGTGGWSISPFLDRVEIIESDAEFVFVVEKDAALLRLSEAKWWEDYPCIILTGKGSADIATRMFLRMLVKELDLPAFCLVDSDPYGHYIYSVYLRGSKRLSYESPFLATPKLHLLGVLSRDLDQYNIPDNCRLKMSTADIKRTQEMLKEPFVQKNLNWVEDLELMLYLKRKAEIQSMTSHGFEYLTDSYLPTKITTGDWI
ncbi:MAG: hypothetical protein LUQ65_12055, partial [Candidatus Helarchaeota archaeon]|nr:hypothetical protein [Candidatus Helarchaeota archaeon]